MSTTLPVTKTTYQLGWYIKRVSGPGRRALVGTEMVPDFDAAIDKIKGLLADGHEVRILPLPTVQL